jgi:hypothetical protein
MKTRPAVPQSRSSLKSRLGSTALVLLLAAALFLASAAAGVLLPPLNPPVYALNPPPPQAAQAAGSPGVNGTLASFAALFPQLSTFYVPVVAR